MVLFEKVNCDESYQFGPQRAASVEKVVHLNTLCVLFSVTIVERLGLISGVGTAGEVVTDRGTFL